MKFKKIAYDFDKDALYPDETLEERFEMELELYEENLKKMDDMYSNIKKAYKKMTGKDDLPDLKFFADENLMVLDPIIGKPTEENFDFLFDISSTVYDYLG